MFIIVEENVSDLILRYKKYKLFPLLAESFDFKSPSCDSEKTLAFATELANSWVLL